VAQAPGGLPVNAVDGEEVLARRNGAQIIRDGGNLLVDIAVVGVDGAQVGQTCGLGRGPEVLRLAFLMAIDGVSGAVLGNHADQ
jgi:hypothetical protein